jgi:hypothetical protein
MLIKVSSIIAMLILSAYAIAAGAQNRASSFESFKQEMMPQVGKQITVVGILKSGKLGWLVTFKDWGVYIYAVKDSDISKMNDLNRFEGHTVEVTGTLRYFPEPPPPKSERVEAIPPEHFYFDVAEAKVMSLNRPRPRRSNRRRGRKTSMLSTPPNNSFNRSANSVAFMRETWLLLWFVAPG